MEEPDDAREAGFALKKVVNWRWVLLIEVTLDIYRIKFLNKKEVLI